MRDELNGNMPPSTSIISSKDPVQEAIEAVNFGKTRRIATLFSLISNICRIVFGGAICFVIFSGIFIVFAFLVFGWSVHSEQPGWSNVRESLMAGIQPEVLNDIKSYEEVLPYLENVLIPFAYPTTYNGESTTGTDKTEYINGVIRRLGSIRLRQIRTNSQSCDLMTMNGLDQSYTSTYPCYGSPNTFTALIDTWRQTDDGSFNPISTASFGTTDQYTWDSSWTCREPMSITQGNLGTYSGAGFLVELDADLNSVATAQVQALTPGGFMDRATRALFVDFSAYAPDANLLAAVRILFEFGPFGEVVVDPRVTVFNPPVISFTSVSDYDPRGDVALGWQPLLMYIIVICLMVAVVNEAIGCLCSPCTSCCAVFGLCGMRVYWFNLWNYVDLTNVAAMVGLAAGSMMMVSTLTIIEMSIANADSYIPLSYVGNTFRILCVVFAVNVVLITMRLFKYLSHTKELSVLVHMMNASASEMVIFCSIFFLFISGYAATGMALFGQDMSDFEDIVTSLISMFKMLIGDLTFQSMVDVNPILGPPFYISFVVIATFICLNVFIAIVSASYAKVIEEIGEKSMNVLELFIFIPVWPILFIPCTIFIATEAIRLISVAASKPTLEDILEGSIRRGMYQAIALNKEHDSAESLVRYICGGDGVLHSSGFKTLLWMVLKSPRPVTTHLAKLVASGVTGTDHSAQDPLSQEMYDMLDRIEQDVAGLRGEVPDIKPE